MKNPVYWSNGFFIVHFSFLIKRYDLRVSVAAASTAGGQ
jgi:hypothetical protein